MATTCCDRIQPMVNELESALALLIDECDGYRSMLGLNGLGPTRRFTRGDLIRGRDLCPTSRIENENVLIVKLES
jgi:hypothetical protein